MIQNWKIKDDIVMTYVENGELLGREYSSRELVKIMSYVKFQTINEAVEYVEILAREVNIEVLNDLLNEENFTAFIIGFHNGTILSGKYDPKYMELM